jgi:hypothetical protein
LLVVRVIGILLLTVYKKLILYVVPPVLTPGQQD